MRVTSLMFSIAVTVGLVNCYSADLAARVQVIFTAAKLGALAVIMIGGVIRLSQGQTTVPVIDCLASYTWITSKACEFGQESVPFFFFCPEIWQILRCCFGIYLGFFIN